MKRQGVLALQGKSINISESIVVEASPEIKRKKSENDLMCDKQSKALKTGFQPVKKKQQWVSSSFHGFTDQPISKLISEKSNRKFGSRRKDNSGEEARPTTLSTQDVVLWCDKYCPLSEADLAVHKKKVAEVRDWLLAKLCSQAGSGILLLTGPPGAGKTATLQVLAKEIGLEIQEWINPLNPFVKNDLVESDWRNYEDMVRPESQLKRFQDFFLRANKYPCLSLGSSDVNHGKKIILIEDMPNLFYRSAVQLHDLLSHYAISSRNPVVFIISDSNSNDTNAYRLFPKNVIEKLHISTISFNPASVTSLNKVANKIVSTEGQKRDLAFQAPSKEVIDSLVSGCNGDIRGMINNLQFSCLKGCSSTFQKQKHLKRLRSTRESKSQSRKSKKISENESSSVSMVGGKDTSLFLFRVLGKILYCKREEDCSTTTTTTLPLHLKHHERRPLIENPENVFEKSHMSADNLALYLHQNYTDFFNNVDDVSVACDYLSDADHLTSEWMHRSTLCEYTPCLAIRGLMFCNQGRSGKGGWRPLHKPQWYSVMKNRRSNFATALELFHEHTRDASQLHCEIIPYLALCDVPLRSPGQITYLQTISQFSKNTSSLRDPNSTLQEKEIDDEETETRSSQPQVTHVRPIKIDDLTQTSQAEEEDNIEEFEDD